MKQNGYVITTPQKKIKTNGINIIIVELTISTITLSIHIFDLNSTQYKQDSKNLSKNRPIGLYSRQWQVCHANQQLTILTKIISKSIYIILSYLIFPKSVWTRHIHMLLQLKGGYHFASMNFAITSNINEIRIPPSNNSTSVNVPPPFIWANTSIRIQPLKAIKLIIKLSKISPVMSFSCS